MGLHFTVNDRVGAQVIEDGGALKLAEESGDGGGCRAKSYRRALEVLATKLSKASGVTR